jgi:hypothetical protein
LAQLTQRSSRGADVRVVVGEAMPYGEGSLRSVLEAAGVNVLGQASEPEDLERIVRAADPDVLVLDVAAGAMTVLAAREWAPRTAIVVVWPAAVQAEGADQHVEPSRVPTDLVPAVLAAPGRHRTPTPRALRIADVVVVPDVETDLAEPDPVPSSADVVPLVVPEIGGYETAAAESMAGVRRLRSSLALVAASLFLVLVVALASQPVTPSGTFAQGPEPAPGQGPTPGQGGPGGIDGNGHLEPSATGPRNLVGSSSLSEVTVVSTLAGGRVRAPAPRRAPQQRRRRRRHNRRQRRRRRGDKGGDQGGDHGQSGDPHGHNGDPHGQGQGHTSGASHQRGSENSNGSSDGPGNSAFGHSHNSGGNSSHGNPHD